MLSSIIWGLSYLTSPSVGGKRVHSRLQTEGMVPFVAHVTHQHFSVLSWVPTNRDRERVRERGLYEMGQHRTIHILHINSMQLCRFFFTVVTWMIVVAIVITPHGTVIFRRFPEQNIFNRPDKSTSGVFIETFASFVVSIVLELSFTANISSTCYHVNEWVYAWIITEDQPFPPTINMALFFWEM